MTENAAWDVFSSQRGPDGHENAITQWIRALARRVKDYCTARREVIAVIHFLKHCRLDLLGKQFLVWINHKSLLWIQSFHDPDVQIACCREYSNSRILSANKDEEKHGNGEVVSRRPMCPQRMPDLYCSCTANDVTPTGDSRPDIQPCHHSYPTIVPGDEKNEPGAFGACGLISV